MSMTDDPKPAARQHVEIYTDGACEPNPGLGGYGAVLLHPKKRAETSGGFRFAYPRHPRLNDALPGLKS
jgi:ribonuclease HI